jgi:site-specific DNA-methyltransferase (adenine-specific)
MRVEQPAEGVTLYCGDCREILPMLGQYDLIFTDPPYGHNNNNGDLIHNRESALGLSPNCELDARPIANDSPEETARLIEWFFSELPKHLAAGCCCCCCCCGGGGPDPQFARWSLELDKNLDFKQMVVWDKGPIGMGWHYRRSYETILVAQKPGAACRWFDDTQQIENIIRPGWRGIAKIIPGKEEHPTPKPPELARHFIRLHTEPDHHVMDPFMGAGSTGIAAIKEGRRFTGIEIEPRWFDLACQRLSATFKQPDMFIEQPKPVQLSMVTT